VPPVHRLLALIVALACVTTAPAAEVKSVAPKDAARLVAEGKAVLVDVREPPEWKDSGVAAPAVLLPMSDFTGEQKQWKEFLAKNGDRQILLYCRSGGRSSAVADALAAKGLNVGNVGTLRDWIKAGLPVRQVE
jgi:rhodanese-related sulfurtransferase